MIDTQVKKDAVKITTAPAAEPIKKADVAKDAAKVEPKIAK